MYSQNLLQCWSTTWTTFINCFQCQGLLRSQNVWYFHKVRANSRTQQLDRNLARVRWLVPVVTCSAHDPLPERVPAHHVWWHARAFYPSKHPEQAIWSTTIRCRHKNPFPLKNYKVKSEIEAGSSSAVGSSPEAIPGLVLRLTVFYFIF